MTESWSANFKPLGSLAHVGLSSRHPNAIANHRLCALLFQFNKGKFIPSNRKKGGGKNRRLWLLQEQKMPKSISCELVFSDGEADPSWCEANLYKKNRMQSSFWAWMLAAAVRREDCVASRRSLVEAITESQFYPAVWRRKEVKSRVSVRVGASEQAGTKIYAVHLQASVILLGKTVQLLR